jgi:hypothetical protein
VKNMQTGKAILEFNNRKERLDKNSDQKGI